MGQPAFSNYAGVLSGWNKNTCHLWESALNQIKVMIIGGNFPGWLQAIAYGIFVSIIVIRNLRSSRWSEREKPTSRAEGQRLSCTPTLQQLKETRVKRDISRNFSRFTGVRNRINIIRHQRNLELLILYAVYTYTKFWLKFLPRENRNYILSAI